MENMIKRYPVVFPDDLDKSVPAPNEDLKALLTLMLSKDPNQRIGSDSCEMEIL